MSDLLVLAPAVNHRVWQQLESLAAVAPRMIESSELKGQELEAGVEQFGEAVVRLHKLIEAALAFQCGALLTSPAIEFTYTPEGNMLKVCAGGGIHLHA